MGTILSLEILVGIPVEIKNDYSIGSLKIETQASGAGRQQEQKIIRLLIVETLQQVATIIRLGRAVQTQVLGS